MYRFVFEARFVVRIARLDQILTSVIGREGVIREHMQIEDIKLTGQIEEY